MSSGIDEKKLAKLSALARLEVEPQRVGKLCKDLSSIFDYMDELNGVNVEGVEPLYHVHGSSNQLREDALQPHLEIKKSLQNAPDSSGRFFRTPLIIE